MKRRTDSWPPKKGSKRTEPSETEHLALSRPRPGGGHGGSHGARCTWMEQMSPALPRRWARYTCHGPRRRPAPAGARSIFFHFRVKAAISFIQDGPGCLIGQVCEGTLAVSPACSTVELFCRHPSRTSCQADLNSGRSGTRRQWGWPRRRETRSWENQTPTHRSDFPLFSSFQRPEEKSDSLVSSLSRICCSESPSVDFD